MIPWYAASLVTATAAADDDADDNNDDDDDDSDDGVTFAITARHSAAVECYVEVSPNECPTVSTYRMTSNAMIRFCASTT